MGSAQAELPDIVSGVNSNGRFQSKNQEKGHHVGVDLSRKKKGMRKLDRPSATLTGAEFQYCVETLISYSMGEVN